MRIDERVAGFTALGIGRETRMPAVVVCTSGTAAANLLPAALEAHHAGVPLLLLTADRPPELRGVGANQTTRQPGMFAPSTRFEADLPVPEATDAEGDGEQSLMLRAGRGRGGRGGARRGTALAGPGAPEPSVSASRSPATCRPGSACRPPSSPPRSTTTPTPRRSTSPTEDEASGALYQGGGGIGEADLPARARGRPVRPAARTAHRS